MQFKLAALAAQAFYYPLVISVPTENLDETDNPISVDVGLLVKYQAIPRQQVKASFEAAQGKDETKPDALSLLNELDENIKKYCVGFKKHPDFDWPFEDRTEADLTVDDVLNIRFFNDAIPKNYQTALKDRVIEKN